MKIISNFPVYSLGNFHLLWNTPSNKSLKGGEKNRSKRPQLKENSGCRTSETLAFFRKSHTKNGDVCDFIFSPRISFKVTFQTLVELSIFFLSSGTLVDQATGTTTTEYKDDYKCNTRNLVEQNKDF